MVNLLRASGRCRWSARFDRRSHETYHRFMRVTRISQGGQIQIPAEVRKRWGTRDVIVDDGGSFLRIRPMPDDPISSVAGIFARPGGPTTEELIRHWRDEDINAEERKQARYDGSDRS